MTEEATISAVSAPALPNATVIETSEQPKAPSGDAHQSDASGMSESQTAALAWVDSHRAQAAKGDNVHLQNQMRKALAHVFSGGASPDFLASTAAKSAEALANDNRPISAREGELSFVAAGLQPMTPGQNAQLVTHAKHVGMDPEAANMMGKFAERAGLDTATANTIADRFAKHDLEGPGVFEAISESEHAELYTEAARLAGGEEKFAETSRLARDYLESVGLLGWTDKYLANSSVVYDVRVLNALAFRARAAGLGKK